jgi:hypothetical protein
LNTRGQEKLEIGGPTKKEEDYASTASYPSIELEVLHI